MQRTGLAAYFKACCMFSIFSYMLSNKGQFPMLMSSWENFMDAVHMFGAVVLSGAVGPMI